MLTVRVLIGPGLPGRRPRQAMLTVRVLAGPGLAGWVLSRPLRLDFLMPS
jgi:hypothetical protein